MTLTREEVLAELTGPEGPFRIDTAEIDGIDQRIYADAPANLRDVLLATAAQGERDFLVYENHRWSFAEHFRRAAALSQFLVDRGIRPGDRVAIGMRNYPEWALAFWASQAIVRRSGDPECLVDGRRAEVRHERFRCPRGGVGRGATAAPRTVSGVAETHDAARCARRGRRGAGGASGRGDRPVPGARGRARVAGGGDRPG